MSDHLLTIGLFLLAIITVVLTIVLVALAIPPALESGQRLYKSWREGRMSVDPPSDRTRQGFGPLFNLVVAVLLFVVFLKMWIGAQVSEGFNSSWPDALRCTSYIPNGSNQTQTQGVPSEGFYYLSATFQVGNHLGTIVRYDYLGGIATLSINDDSAVALDQPHYRRQLVNQVWFAMGGPNKGRRVFRRDSVRNVPLKEKQRPDDLIMKDKDKILFEALHDENDAYEQGFADTTRYTPLCGKNDDPGDSLSEISGAGNAFVLARKF